MVLGRKSSESITEGLSLFDELVQVDIVRQIMTGPAIIGRALCLLSR